MQNDIIFIRIQVITIEYLKAVKELLLIRRLFPIAQEPSQIPVDFQRFEESFGRKNFEKFLWCLFLFTHLSFENTIKREIMTPEEAKVFENDPLFADSLLIRKYDELAKIGNMKINVSC